MKYLISLLFLGLSHFLIAQESEWKKELIQKLEESQDSFQIKKKYQVKKQIRLTKKLLDIGKSKRVPAWGKKEAKGNYQSNQTYFCFFISYKNQLDVLVYMKHARGYCFIFENDKLKYCANISDYIEVHNPKDFAKSPRFWSITKL